MKWIIGSCRDKERRIPVSEKLAAEILAAYQNEVSFYLIFFVFILLVLLFKKNFFIFIFAYTGCFQKINPFQNLRI